MRQIKILPLNSITACSFRRNLNKKKEKNENKNSAFVARAMGAGRTRDKRRTFKCPFKPLLANLSYYMMSLQNMSSHECAILHNLLKMRQTNPKRHFVEHLMCHLLPTNFIKPVLIFTQQSILILIYNHLYTHLSSINLTQMKNKKSLEYKSS